MNKKKHENYNNEPDKKTVSILFVENSSATAGVRIVKIKQYSIRILDKNKNYFNAGGTVIRKMCWFLYFQYLFCC